MSCLLDLKKAKLLSRQSRSRCYFGLFHMLGLEFSPISTVCQLGKRNKYSYNPQMFPCQYSSAFHARQWSILSRNTIKLVFRTGLERANGLEIRPSLLFGLLFSHNHGSCIAGLIKTAANLPFEVCPRKKRCRGREKSPKWVIYKAPSLRYVCICSTKVIVPK